MKLCYSKSDHWCIRIRNVYQLWLVVTLQGLRWSSISSMFLLTEPPEIELEVFYMRSRCQISFQSLFPKPKATAEKALLLAGDIPVFCRKGIWVGLNVVIAANTVVSIMGGSPIGVWVKIIDWSTWPSWGGPRNACAQWAFKVYVLSSFWAHHSAPSAPTWFLRLQRTVSTHRKL